MEAWKFCKLFICITSYFLCLQALESSRYMGCFKDDIFRKTIWSPKTVFNNGDRCIRTCRGLGHLYAATQSYYCKCGTSIRGNPQQVRCQYRCPGYRNEICGGQNSMSVYSIRLLATKPSLPAQTNALITSTESINSFTEQYVYNEGEADSGPVAAYISVPVSGIFAVACTTAFIIFICRKRRSADDNYVCHHRKPDADSCHLYRHATSNSHDFNNVKHKDSFKYRTDDMRKPSSNAYTEIPSELVSETSENEHNSASFSLRHGRCKTVVTKANDSYDTRQGRLKVDTRKTTDKYKTGYDHVVTC